MNLQSFSYVTSSDPQTGMYAAKQIQLQLDTFGVGMAEHTAAGNKEGVEL